jgi:hypothetical protein
MNMKRFNSVALGIAAGVFSSRSAIADTVTGYTNNPLPALQIGIAVNGDNGVFNNYTATEYSGAINWTRTASTGATPAFQTYNPSTGAGTSGTATFTSFCIDLVENVGVPSGPYTYDVVDPTAAPLRSASPSYNTISSSGKAILESLWFDNISTAMTSDVGQAAFQIAIWDVVFGSDYTHVDNTSSNFYVTPGGQSAAVIALANSWLQTTATQISGGSAIYENLLALTSSGAQDQLVSTGDFNVGSPGGSPVPLPLTASGGLSLFGILAANELRRGLRSRVRRS